MSGPYILLKITLELMINSQNIWRRVVRWILINISFSNIIWKFLFWKRLRKYQYFIILRKFLNANPYLWCDPHDKQLAPPLPGCCSSVQSWSVSFLSLLHIPGTRWFSTKGRQTWSRWTPLFFQICTLHVIHFQYRMCWRKSSIIEKNLC